MPSFSPTYNYNYQPTHHCCGHLNSQLSNNFARQQVKKKPNDKLYKLLLFSHHHDAMPEEEEDFNKKFIGHHRWIYWVVIAYIYIILCKCHMWVFDHGDIATSLQIIVYVYKTRTRKFTISRECATTVGNSIFGLCE